MPKDNSKNRQYTKEFKASVLKRLEPPSNETVPKISEELGISASTIYQWISTNNKKKNQDIVFGKHKPSAKWSSEDKFHVVLEAFPLTEEELAEYCRRKNYYVNKDPIRGPFILALFKIFSRLLKFKKIANLYFFLILSNPI